MAEIAGVIASGVTLAGLFASCIEIFSVIEMHRNADEDQAILSTRLKIEQCRLYMWGTKMGLTNGPDEQSNKHNPTSHLSGTPFENVVHDILKSIFMLFNNTVQIQGRYGCENLKLNNNQAEISNAASMINLEPLRESTYNAATTLRQPPNGRSTVSTRTISCSRASTISK